MAAAVVQCEEREPVEVGKDTAHVQELETCQILESDVGTAKVLTAFEN